MNRFRLLLVAAVAALVLVVAQAAFATTVKKLSLQELTKNSESIIRATVVSANSSWDTSHKEIYTFTTLRVLQSVKGSAGAMIMLRQIGGTVGNIASVVPGMPSFRKGEEVVLFLTQKDAAGYPWIMGLQQGKYSVVEENGVKMVRNDLAGTELLSPNGKHMESTTAPDQPLNAFIDGIKTTLGADGRIQVDPKPQTE